MGTNNNIMLKHLAPWPRGSEWRKWDLHVHTKADSGYRYDPDFSISNREQNDAEYAKVFIEHIYSINKLGAIAITDHNKSVWLDPIIEENKRISSERGNKGITIFPGVETESSDGIHLLVIFNPDSQSDEVNHNYRKSTWKDTIEHFLTAIGITAGSNSSKTTEEILEEAEKWDAIGIFAHVTSDKGFLKHSSGTTKTRIYKHKLAQIFHIPNGGITDAGQQNIIEGRDSMYCDEAGNPKSVACISASDAKKLKDIATNNCWIKADPTFEGLKQIIYEPDDRRYIGEEPPRKLDRTKIIKSVSISRSNNWFEDDKPIVFNEGLVSIIGGKGSGKTAILDLIAYATGSYKCYETDATKSKSFLKKAFRELRGLKIKVEWDEGEHNEIIIADKLGENTKEGEIRYLPQDFIDQLCTEIGKSELEEQIENVIFQQVAPENRANYSDFRGYKESQLNVINDKKNRVAEQIEGINSKIYEHSSLIASKNSKNDEIRKVEDDIKRFEGEMKKISEILKDFKDQKEILDKLNSSAEEKSNLEKAISELKTKTLKIEGIKNEVSVFIENSTSFASRLGVALKIVGIKKGDIEAIKIVLFPENLQQILDDKKREIENEIKKEKEILDNLDIKIKELNSNIKLEKSKQDKIKEINKSLSELKKKKDSLNIDINNIEDAEKELPELLGNRENLFINYFGLILKEKEILKEIYLPLENILKESKEENEKLFDFAVQFNFDYETMAREGDKLIDHSNKGRFLRSDWEALKVELESQKFYPNLDKQPSSKEDIQLSLEDKTLIKNYLKNVEKLFSQDEKGEHYTISSQLRNEYTEQDFFTWLYSTRYYAISYSIKFNGIELQNLSPGLKGVALLILFLELDKEDKRPIFIDQPEENLDNRSVYLTLMRYFREAKKRRQVMIITHNPNLVVNGDSEQIIVANFDRNMQNQKSRIGYVSGSLENTFRDEAISNVLRKQGIREHVCEILEGGKEAFEKRERKYGFRH
jgi:hypothetical protein